MDSIDTISIPEAPAIPGLRFRRFQDESDFDAIANVLILGHAEDGVNSNDSVQLLTNLYRHQEGFDLQKDLILAEIDGKIIAYARMFTFIEVPERHRVLNVVGFVHPDWRRKGLGRAMLRANEQHARSVAAVMPPEPRSSFYSYADRKEVGNRALLEQEGFRPIRSGYYMVRPDLENIPDLPLPPGLEVRPVLPEHYRLIWDAGDEAFRDHWGFQELGEDTYQGYLSSPNFQPDLWQVAWDGDQVAGMVRGFIDHAENERYGFLRGWTEDIAVRRPYRHQGLAKALIARSLQALKERGMQQAALGVDAENLSGALNLYLYMGYQVKDEQIIYQKPLDSAVPSQA